MVDFSQLERPGLVRTRSTRVDDFFDKLRFVNEIRTQIVSQVREEVRTLSVQDTVAIKA
jgi:hypothetical protein